MKTIQITMDERLLRTMDQDAEVKRDGRSAVFRRAVADYLKRRRRKDISAAYARGYGERGADELSGWADEGAWPES
jgi:metal-responsive CopG/Arc/MetJ family transcriptional regulator